MISAYLLSVVAFCSLAILIFLVLLWYYQYFKFERYIGVFDGPTPLPIIGNALEFNSSSALMPSCYKYQLKHKGNFRIYLGYEPYIIVGDPKLAEFILSSTKILRKTRPYGFLRNWLGEGILTSCGDQSWKQHRKMITPAFHFGALESFVETFNATGNVLISLLKEKVGKGPFDISSYITFYALDVICETSMGTQIDAQRNPTSDYVTSVGEMCKILIERTLSASQQYDWAYQWSDNYKHERKALKVLHDHTNEVIHARKSFLRNGGTVEGKRKNMLDILLKQNVEVGSLTDDELRAEVDTMMFAGHDTTATTMNFLIYCLSNNQDVQKKAYEEVLKVLGDDLNKEPSYQELQDMKYLDLVIKETLRIYTTVPLVGREIEEDVMFEDKMLPKGLSLLISLNGIHRDPKWFPNPDNFDPERFLPENTKGRNPFIYTPFSAGPRNCIGQKFAMLEIKSAVSKILKHFEVLAPIPKHEIDLVSECVLKPRNGVVVHLRPRISV